ncbi:MAG: LysM peptidoglycan-binding domain-containing protein [Caldilineaceae bacterium]
MRSPSFLYRLGAQLTLGLVLAVSLLPSTRILAQDAAQPASPPAADSVVVLAAGDIATCNLEWDSQTGALLDNLPGTILALGDNAYVTGSLQEFNDCYGPTWGRHKDRIYPVPGNHEYLTGGAEGYFTYFGDRATPLEPGCRKECKGYYSFDLGGWHIVALNSEIDNNPGSEQDLWLRADLAAHPNVCTLAYWHKPRWSSGDHGSGASAPLFQAVYDYGVDLVLSGHDHDYERFAPQSPQGVLEYDRGVRQFVVGTGGGTLRSWESSAPNSEVKDSDTWGVLKLTLHPTSYDWEFIPIAGQTFTDSGSANCVTAGSVPPAPAASTIPVSTGAAPVDVESDADDMAAAGSSAAALPAGGLDYVVQAGDTLSLISLRYGLDWEVVAQVNGITNTEVIEVGQVIRLPGVAAAEPATTPTVTGTSTAGTAALTSPAATTAASTAEGTSYTVVAGDTLFGIALRANVTLQELLAANNMQEDDILLIGQTLTIPGRAAPLPSLSALVPAGSSRTALTGSTTVTGTRPVTTTGVTATAGITTTRTTTSTTAPTASSLLASPTPRPSASSTLTGTSGTATATGASTYTVAEGDTIITIALAHNLDWQELLALNDLQPDSLLQVGQQIRLR